MTLEHHPMESWLALHASQLQHAAASRQIWERMLVSATAQGLAAPARKPQDSPLGGAAAAGGATAGGLGAGTAPVDSSSMRDGGASGFRTPRDSAQVRRCVCVCVSACVCVCVFKERRGERKAGGECG